jgi:hypothetical protein
VRTAGHEQLIADPRAKHLRCEATHRAPLGAAVIVAGAALLGHAPSAGGIITTLAGGPGGPGQAGAVATTPCGLGYSGGSLYVGDANANGSGDSVQRISTSTGRLTTAAGNGATLGGGYGAAAIKASLPYACGTAVDSAGNLLIANQTTVQAVAARSGTFYGVTMAAGHVYTVAGQSTHPGTGTATRTKLTQAVGVAVDSSGNLVIADNGTPAGCPTCTPRGALVQVVAAADGTFYGQKMTVGHIYQVAGNGQTGSTGDGGPALGASLESAAGVAVDAAGNLVIADSNRVRVVAGHTGTFYGQQMTAGDIYAIAGTGAAGYSGAGGPAIDAQVTARPVVLDGAGNVVIGDSDVGFAVNEERVQAIAVKTGTFYGQQMTAGHIYDVAGTGSEYSGDGASPSQDVITDPVGVATNAAGDMTFADGGGEVIWAVPATSGTFYGRTLAAGHSYLIGGTGQTGCG